MEMEKLKRAILQYLLKCPNEFTRGKVLDATFSCSERARKDAIESLRFDGFPIVSPEDKRLGYRYSFSKIERQEYYMRREKELKVQFAAIKTMRAKEESGELFAQDFVIQKQIEKELVETNG
jgi:biotin operon repressor